MTLNKGACDEPRGRKTTKTQMIVLLLLSLFLMKLCHPALRLQPLFVYSPYSSSSAELAARTEGKSVLQERVKTIPDDYDAHFDLAICLIAEHDYQQAMEALFTILEQEPDYKEGAAREMIIKLINIIQPNNVEMAQSFRRRLGSVVAS